MKDDSEDGSDWDDEMSLYSFKTASDASMSLDAGDMKSDGVEAARPTCCHTSLTSDTEMTLASDNEHGSDASVALDDDADENAEDVVEEPAITKSYGVFAGEWAPGWNVGTWVSRHSPLSEQGRVLAANVAIVLRRLPASTVQCIIHAGREESSTRKRSRIPFIDAAACLLRLSAHTIKVLYYELRGKAWDPAIARLETSAGKPENALVADNAAVLLTLSRTALSSCAVGASKDEYTKQVARLAVEGVAVGDQHHSANFMDDAVYLGARCLQLLDAQDLRTPLKGLGIRSSLALLLDGVPVGGAALYGRHGSVTVLCVNFVSPHTYRLHSRCIGYAIQRRGHGGEEVAVEVLEVLESAPMGLSPKELRSCLACIGGDGQAVRGGPDRKLPGTQAGEHIWFSLFPSVYPDVPELDQPLRMLVGQDPRPRVGWPPRGWETDGNHLHASTEWDKFHRQDIVLVRAISSSAPATELYTVCKMMDHMFGLGDGRLLVQNAAQAVDTKLQRGCLPGMTRKAVGLCAEPGHLLTNFKAYAAALHVREAWRKEDHTTYTQSVLIDAGRRLTSLPFVAFVLLFRDIMKKIMSPWSLAIQSACVEPWVLAVKRQQHLKIAAQSAGMLHWLRELLRVLVLFKTMGSGGRSPSALEGFVVRHAPTVFSEQCGLEHW